MSLTDDISLMLAKAKKFGFFENLSPNEVNYLQDEATALFSTDTVFKAIRANLSTLNILDYGVSRDASTDQTPMIKTALDSNPGKTFYFPPGDYRCETGLVVSAGNNLVFDIGARLYAAAPMDVLFDYLWTGSGYAEDKQVIGGFFDGNLNANTIMTMGKIIRFTLTRATFKDGINRGLVTKEGLGAELFAYDLRFYNTTVSNVNDNIAIEAKMGDSHFRDIVMRDWTVAVKDTGGNRWDRVHPWIGPNMGANTHMNLRYPISTAFDLRGSSDLQGCLSDTYKTGFKFTANESGFTTLPRLRNCRAAWVDQPTLPQAIIDANQAHCFDNTEGVGVDCSDFSVKGHNTGTPVKFLLGPSTKLNVRNTHSHGFVIGDQSTTNDSMNYRNGVQQGEFTFTPTVYGSGSVGVHAYTLQTGRMIVTESKVTYAVRIQAVLDATTGFAGVVRIGNVPLPFGATGLRDGVGNLGFSIGVNTSSACIFANVAPYISLMTMGASGGSEVDIVTQSLRGKTVDLMIQVTSNYYKT